MRRDGESEKILRKRSQMNGYKTKLYSDVSVKSHKRSLNYA